MPACPARGERIFDVAAGLRSALRRGLDVDLSRRGTTAGERASRSILTDADRRADKFKPCPSPFH